MRKLCCALWIFLLTLTVPALAAPGKRAFFPPQPVAEPSWVKKIVTGDFNGDGKLDFATLAWETGDRCVIAGIHYDRGFLVRVYRNTTPAGALNPTFAAPEELPYIDGACASIPCGAATSRRSTSTATARTTSWSPTPTPTRSSPTAAWDRCSRRRSSPAPRTTPATWPPATSTPTAWSTSLSCT